MKTRPPAWVICAAAIVVAVAATFGRTCRYGFVGGWDDGPLIYANALVNTPDASAVVNAWRGPHARMYIPMVYTTWWGLAQVARVPGEPALSEGSLDPRVFHVANVLVHTISALLVFGILRRLVPSAAAAACAGALLFALHPLQVEPVAWATGMKDLLCGVLSLAALLLHVRVRTNADAGAVAAKRRRVEGQLATTFLILALLAKPAAVVVPAIAFVIDWLLLGRHWKRAATALVPWFGLAVLFMLISRDAQPTPEIPAPPLVARPLIAADALGFYLAKLAWPAKLGIDYGLRPDVIVTTYWWLLTLAVAAAALLSRRRWVIAAALIFAIGVAPVLGLTPFVFQWLSTVADRYVYLSMLGAAVAVAFLLARFPQPAVKIVCAGLLIALAARSYVQAGVWRNLETLARHALEINPRSPAGHNFVGYVLFDRGDVGGALNHFESAVAEAPKYPAARDNLVAALVATGQLGRAADVLEETIELRRSLPPPLAQPVDDDLAKLAYLRRRLAESPATTTTAPATNKSPPAPPAASDTGR
jgi:tetratricopeptide (TPR) repeat protein